MDDLFTETQADPLREYQSFVRGMAKVLDNLDRWRESARDEEASRCEAITNQAFQLFLQHGIRPVAALGEAFDPNYHEVIAVEKSEAPKDQIIGIPQMGYEMNLAGRPPILLRTARVVVSGEPEPGSTPPEAKAAAEAEAESSEA